MSTPTEVADVDTVDALVAAATRPVMPVVSQPPRLTVELPHGYYDGRQRLTTAVIRELRGEDEEVIAPFDIMRDDWVFLVLKALLPRSVVSIGGMDIGRRPEILDQLLLGERFLLFFEILKATFGVVRKFDVTCNFCKGENLIEANLDEEIEVHPLDKPVEWTETVVIDGEHHEITVALLTGEDNEYVFAKKTATGAERSTYAFARSIRKIDGETVSETYAERAARAMSMRDRRALLREMTDRQPGPRLKEVAAVCARCGEENSYSLAWATLLYT